MRKDAPTIESKWPISRYACRVTKKSEMRHRGRRGSRYVRRTRRWTSESPRPSRSSCIIAACVGGTRMSLPLSKPGRWGQPRRAANSTEHADGHTHGRAASVGSSADGRGRALTWPRRGTGSAKQACTGREPGQSSAGCTTGARRKERPPRGSGAGCRPVRSGCRRNGCQFSQKCG
jgi:hypothetical protein